MKKFLFLALAAAMCLPAMAGNLKANNDTKQYRYEIECAGSAVSGTYLVRVYSYARKANVAENQCRKNAVHGVIFKGVAAADNGCSYKAPLVKTPGAEDQYKDFFASFFADGGEFQRYASIVAGTQEITKVGKEYKVGVTVSIQIDQLRKALESAGIIRGLSTGF